MTATSGQTPDSMSAAADARGLEALVARAARAGKGLPPVERWNPPFAAISTWKSARTAPGSISARPSAACRWCSFSTVLRQDADGRTYLVTPVERVGIRVVDAPFVAVEVNVSLRGGEQVITFRTNVGDVVEVGPSNPLRFVDEAETGGLKPYVLVRGRLEALVARPAMYELVGHGEEIEVDGVAMFALRSNGEVYPVMPAARLAELSA